MTDKVKLPKDVAEELAAMNQHESYPIRLVIDIFHGDIGVEDSALKRYFESDRSRRIEIIMKALINGYEVEQTPEDKVKNMFDTLQQLKCVIKFPDDSVLERYRLKELNAELNGVINTLELLNIKIEGVNA